MGTNYTGSESGSARADHAKQQVYENHVDDDDDNECNDGDDDSDGNNKGDDDVNGNYLRLHWLDVALPTATSSQRRRANNKQNKNVERKTHSST